jgi:dihydroorotase
MTLKGVTMENAGLDLLLKGGHLIDPANGIDGQMDLGIVEGKIARLAAEISPGEAKQTIALDGLVVTPGILDIHTHVYPFQSRGKNYVEAVDADAHLLASGVTTTVDVGTAGWKDFPDFVESTIRRSKVRILAMVNIASGGMVDAETEQTEAEMQPEIAAAVARAYPEIVVGIKTAHYWTTRPWDDWHHPWSSVERAVEAGELCGLPVMVDFWPRPPERSYPDLLLQKLRPGDIHTHVFAQQFPVLAADGGVSDFMFAARERGIFFDLGHGAGSFWFRNAVPAFQGGFPPDTISTDLHMANINGPVQSMANTMSKFLNIGMPLNEVIRRSTVEPARLIRQSRLGTLSIGAEADVAVFELLQGHFSFADCGKARMSGGHKLEARMTLRTGQVVFDPYGLSMPEWQDAPPEYWRLKQ